MFLYDYIIQSSAYLAVTCLLYFLVFRRLTFFTMNRVYLLFMPLLSLILPLCDFSAIANFLQLQHAEVVAYIPQYYTASTETGTPSALLSIAGSTLLLSGISFFAFKMIRQIISLHHLRSHAKLILSEPVNIYQVSDPINPFSFGNSIFLNPERHTEDDLQEIINHELVHVQQRHSADIIFAELLCMFCWFNPFAWLIRVAIRQNLEFIADEEVLKKGFNKKQYQQLLVKVSTGSALSITSHLNFHSLKTRIIMMNKQKSSAMKMIRFLLILPVTFILLLAFTRISSSDVNVPNIVSDTIPDAKTKVKQSAVKDPVVNIHIANQRAEVTLKSGKMEHYDLSKPAELAAYKSKYGDPIPSPPPPAPPAPAKPAESSVPPVPPGPPVPPAPPAPKTGKNIQAAAPVSKDSKSGKITPASLKPISNLNPVFPDLLRKQEGC